MFKSIASTLFMLIGAFWLVVGFELTVNGIYTLITKPEQKDHYKLLLNGIPILLSSIGILYFVYFKFYKKK